MTQPRSLRAALAVGTLAVLAALVAAPAGAQVAPPSPQPAASAPEDERAVLAVVTGLFDAMRTRDTAAIRASFVPGAELTSSSMRDGQPTVGRDSVGAWIAGVASAPPGLVLDERLYSPQVHVSDGLAAVWVEYDLYLGERFSHCGVDAFILVRTAEGWKVSSVADTRRREGCPERQ